MNAGSCPTIAAVGRRCLDTIQGRCFIVNLRVFFEKIGPKVFDLD